MIRGIVFLVLCADVVVEVGKMHWRSCEVAGSKCKAPSPRPDVMSLTNSIMEHQQQLMNIRIN